MGHHTHRLFLNRASSGHMNEIMAMNMERKSKNPELKKYTALFSNILDLSFNFISNYILKKKKKTFLQ